MGITRCSYVEIWIKRAFLLRILKANIGSENITLTIDGASNWKIVTYGDSEIYLLYLIRSYNEYYSQELYWKIESSHYF